MYVIISCSCCKEFKLKQLVQDVKLTYAVRWHFGGIGKRNGVIVFSFWSHHRDVRIETLKGVKRLSEGMGWF